MFALADITTQTGDALTTGTELKFCPSSLCREPLTVLSSCGYPPGSGSGREPFLDFSLLFIRRFARIGVTGEIQDSFSVGHLRAGSPTELSRPPVEPKLKLLQFREKA